MTLASPPPTRRQTPYGIAMVAALAGLAALATLYLLPYLIRDVPYPIGGGAPKYVAKARWVSEHGLDMVGAIRSGGSLLMAGLAHVTGQNAFTLFVVVPPLLAGLVGLGGAALARAGLGIRAVWVPVFAFLTWTAFIQNGIIGLRFDNLVNAALLVPGCAAAVACVGWRRGALATAALLAAGGLAHWPFYGFVVGVLMVAVLAWVWLPYRAPWSAWPSRIRRAGPVLGAIGGSAAFVGLSFLARPATGWLGLRSLDFLGDRLRRNLDKIRERSIFATTPLFAAGVLISGTHRPEPEREAAHRLFVLLMAAWVLLTGGAVLAQLVGIPSAGFRLLQFLFPLPILSAVAVWGAARWLARRERWGKTAATLLAAAVVALFGTLTARGWLPRGSHLEAETIRQAAVAGAYLDRVAPGRRSVIILDDALSAGPRNFQIVQAVLPPEQNARTFAYFGSPGRFLDSPPRNGRRTLQFGPASDALGPDPIGIVLRRYHPSGFEEMVARFPEREIAPGVLVVRGPLPSTALPPVEPPAADVSAFNLVFASATILALLFLVGGGFAVALLPPDPILRTLLAPALGTAALLLAVLAWDVAGLRPGGRILVVPVAVTATIGWGTAAFRTRRRSPP